MPALLPGSASSLLFKLWHHWSASRYVQSTCVGPPKSNAPSRSFAQKSKGALILTASPTGAANVNLIIAAAARYKLPAVYIQRHFVAAGGLISYGPNFEDQYRRAADYVNRILKGEKPADLPVKA